MPRQKYRLLEALVLTSSESEDEIENSPSARFVETHRNQGALVFSNSFLRDTKSQLWADQPIKEVGIHGQANVNQVLNNT